MVKFISLLHRDQRGASLPEYAILLGLVLAVTAATLTGIGTDINTIFTNVKNMLDSAAAGTG